MVYQLYKAGQFKMKYRNEIVAVKCKKNGKELKRITTPYDVISSGPGILEWGLFPRFLLITGLYFFDE